MKDRARILVTGAGGFIGHHLVKRLKADGHWVRGVDLVRPSFEESAADEFALLDLRSFPDCRSAVRGVEHVYNLAADTGGIGYIGTHCAGITRNNTLINLHMLEASREEGVARFLVSSSASVYAQFRQREAKVVPLREEDAVPADPEGGYGWEKLYAEQVCGYYAEDYGLDTRVARFYNVYGPLGLWDGGAENAPAALCRKIAKAEDGDTIEVWGDGGQTRSFLYIDDCVEGLTRLMGSNHRRPLNLGTERLIKIGELADLIARIAGKRIHQKPLLSKPQGVRGRSSDNSRLRAVLGWEPSTKLEVGLAATYQWIESEVVRVQSTRSTRRIASPRPTVSAPV